MQPKSWRNSANFLFDSAKILISQLNIYGIAENFPKKTKTKNTTLYVWYLATRILQTQMETKASVATTISGNF